MGLLSSSAVWPTSSSRQHRRCHERAPGVGVPSPLPRVGEWVAVFGSGFRAGGVSTSTVRPQQRLARAFAFAAAALLISAQGSWADQPLGDGDGATPVVSNPVAFGTVCQGSVTSKPVLVAIRRQGGTNISFPNSSSVAVSVGSISPGSLSASGGGTIVLPAGWLALPGNSLSAGTVTINVTLTASTLGSVSGTLVINASGTAASDGDPLTRTDPVPVTANVIACDAAPPVLSLPGPITAEATGPGGAVVTYTATATDANPTNPVVTCVPASGSTFAIGLTTVSCS